MVCSWCVLLSRAKGYSVHFGYLWRTITMDGLLKFLHSRIYSRRCSTFAAEKSSRIVQQPRLRRDNDQDISRDRKLDFSRREFPSSRARGARRARKKLRLLCSSKRRSFPGEVRFPFALSRRCVRAARAPFSFRVSSSFLLLLVLLVSPNFPRFLLLRGQK